MAENSKIEWTHHTDNLWWGCTEVHAGCDNCYARVWAHRYNKDVWGARVPRLAIKNVWSDLARQQRKAHAAGEVHRVFVGSMMDIFEKPMPVVDHQGAPVKFLDHDCSTGDLRDLLFQQIDAGMYPNLLFLLLTKRPSNINKYIPEAWRLKGAPGNVMFGTSIVDQATARKYILELGEVYGYKFLSVEPQLARISFEDCLGDTLKWHAGGLKNIVNWVIQGGESGPNKRPFDVEWARAMRDECLAEGVPYFFKQVDKVQPIPADLMVRQFPLLV